MTTLSPSGALIEGEYRYHLWREWLTGAGRCAFVMLNPSTADEITDDATIRRCRAFADRLGAQALDVVNLFGLRSRDPKALARHPDPVGPRNDEIVREVLSRADIRIAAWGAHPAATLERARAALALHLDYLECFGTALNGAPRHPLMLPRAAPLRPWRADLWHAPITRTHCR